MFFRGILEKFFENFRSERDFANEIALANVESDENVKGGILGDGERHRFSEWLLSRKLVKRNEIFAALMEQHVTGERVGAILVRMGFLHQDRLIESILEFSPDRISSEKVMSSRIPLEVLERERIILNAETEDTIFVSTLDSDEYNILNTIRKFYSDKKIKFVSFSSERFPDFLDTIRRTSMIGKDIKQEEIMEMLIFRALKEGASDVHIEPKQKSYSVFFRKLGDRYLGHEGGLDEYNVIKAQIKDRSRMDLAETRIPQDGGYQLEYSGKVVDLRVTTIPTVEGEKVVARLLDPDKVRPRLDDLGISQVNEWRKAISRQNGLCLICGPTGSGKTTTLNSSVREYDRFGKAIYTIEDPVEYRIPLISQVSINNQVGLDFPRGVKAFMRGDPDTIILGEVRDQETARNAIKAADTGHLVIVTLHTSSIVSSLSRLRDLGVEAHELRFNLRGVLVQTLVKTICPHCHGTGNFEGLKCPKCEGFGYDDRTVVSECVSFSEYSDVDKIIEMVKPGNTQAFEVPWKEMIDDALDKVVVGKTSMNEVLRIFGFYAEERAKKRGIDPDKFMLNEPFAIGSKRD